jgi:predicted dehydrogenase
MTKLKVGVIGVGYLGQFHAEKYRAMPDVELAGIVDADPDRGSQIAGKLNTRSFTDPASLLGLVDAVSIVVPTALHHRVALPFLQNGVHVLLEKPVTVTLEQADELIRVAQRSKAVLQVGHIERFNPAVTAIKTMLVSPKYMTAERAAPFTVRCTDVNVVLDLMIHDLDIVTNLAGSDPRTVCAAGASVITNEIDTATARIVFATGAVAEVTASRVSDEKKRLLRVFDGQNLFTSDYQTQKATVSTRGGNGVPELITREIPTERRDTLNEEIKAFLHSIRSGEQPLVPGSEGRRALALARCITDAIGHARTGFVPVG